MSGLGCPTIPQKFNNFDMMKTFKLLFFSVLLLLIGCDEGENIVDNVTPQMTLSATELQMIPSEVVTLTATVTPVSSNPIEWSSSDASVASVFMGMVTAQKEGQVIITATCGELSKQCLVTIKLHSYELVWSDEFDANELNQNYWNIERGASGWGNQEKQNYTNRVENLRIEGGLLVIEARYENMDGRDQYTSARITTKNKVDVEYGRVEARISLPKGRGTWPAFWMLGYGGWPTCGEIDIMEHIGSNPTMISHALHTAEKNGSNGRNWHYKYYLDNIEDEFHIYAIEWERKVDSGDDCIKFFVDDVNTATVYEPHGIDDKTRWPFFAKHFIILNVALGGTMGGDIDDSIFNEKVEMKVDYVRVYERK